MRTILCTPDLNPIPFTPSCREIRITPVAHLMTSSNPSSSRTPRPILPRTRPFCPPNSTKHDNSSGSSTTSKGDWAKTRSELLRRKIEQRPSRERLVTQHILLTDGRVAPLIEQRARLLRQERIRTNLSRKLKQRPGPLELVTRKILRADEELEHAIQEGRLLFQPTSEHPEEPLFVPSPISTDMEVVSQVVVRQPSKSLNIFGGKGLTRKSPKVSPYKPPEEIQFRSKTKSANSKEIEVALMKDRLPSINQDCSSEQSSYELLLQQQRLFLQWQQDENSVSGPVPQLQEEQKDQVIDLQSSNSPQPISLQQPVRVRRLSDLKVQELKNECKKRQLPVSGAKPQLLDRLRVFEKEIIGCTPPASPEPMKEFSESPEVITISTPEQHYDPNMLQQHSVRHPTQLTTNNSSSVLKSTPIGRSGQLGLQDYMLTPNSRQAPLVLQVQSATSQLVQLVDEKGEVVGMATVQYPPPQQERHSSVMVQQPRLQGEVPVSVHSLAAVQQISSMAPRVVQTPHKISKDDSTYRFAQMGSGGQFTAVQPADRTENEQNHRVLGATEGIDSSPNSRICLPALVTRNEPSSHSHSQNLSQENSRNRAQSFITSNKNQRMASPNLQRSPRTADQPGSSPTMPHSGDTNQLAHHGVIEQRRDSGDVLELDPNDPASVLTPTTLQMHEEMLRSQHKMIATLEKEIASAQTMLKKQQQIILAAKKAQQKLREQQRCEGEVQRGEQQWLRDLDIRHVNKQHIQQFLQHKMHVQTLNTASTEHNRLKTTEARLQEELHVDQAVHDIVRLIKQDPRTALLIVQLLRKYQLERCQTENTQIPKPESEETVRDCGEKAASPEEISGAQEHTVYSQQDFVLQCDSTTSRNEVVICEASGLQPAVENNTFMDQQSAASDKNQHVDMEEIFKSVLEDASRALRDDNAVQVSPLAAPLHDRNDNGSAVASCEGNPSMKDCLPKETIQQGDHRKEVNLNGLRTPVEVDNVSSVFEDSENSYSSLDDVMAVVQADADYPGAPENTFGRMEYGSDELAELLGDDWLNCAERSIANDGQYAPFAHDLDDGRSTDPMSLGPPIEQMESTESDQSSMNMDWLDEMLHHAPVDGHSFGH